MRIKKIIFFNLIFLIFSIIIYSSEIGKPLYLFYKIDIDKNLLTLKWNNEGNNNDVYYIFSKEKSSKWSLLNKDGIIGNQYEMELADNNNKSFVLCKNPELPKMDKSISASSVYDDDFVGMFRELKGTENIESNKIYIAFNIDEVKGFKEVKETKNGNTKEVAINEDVNKTKKGTNETFYVIDNKVVTEEEKERIDKEKEKEANKLVNITNEIAKLNEKDIKDIKGLFKVESNKETKISYMGLKLSIPEEAAPENSYIYIKPLTDESLLKVNDNTENITYSEEGEYKGYNITLLRKEEVKDKRVGKNNFSIEDVLNMPIDISMKFSKGSENDVIFMFFYNKALNRWENVVRIKEINLNDKSITVSSLELGQFYVGLFM